MNSLARASVLLASVALSLTACSNGFDPANDARVRFLNASANAPALDFYVAQKKEAGALPFKTVTTYTDLTAGSWALQISRAGEAAPLASINKQLTPGKDYTVIAFGALANIKVSFYQDDNSAPAAGKFRLRVINSSPAAQALDVYVTAPGADLAAATPAVSNLLPEAASAYLEQTAGTVQVRFTTTGTKTVVHDGGNVVATAGKVRTMVLLDKNGGGLPLQSGVLNDRE